MAINRSVQITHCVWKNQTTLRHNSKRKAGNLLEHVFVIVEVEVGAEEGEILLHGQGTPQ